MIKLGDLVERITYYTGIKWVVNCNCDKRHEDWNKIKIDRYGRIR
jgi:hypothetical protein